MSTLAPGPQLSGITGGWRVEENHQSSSKLFILMVARDGIEPPTPAFSGPSTEFLKWSGISGNDWKHGLYKNLL
jgi:hypothetical protein